MKNNDLLLNEVTSRLDAFMARINEQRRPLHYVTLVKVPDGPVYRCHLHVSPLTRVILSYRFEPEPIH